MSVEGDDMGCPKCFTGWQIIDGVLKCPACGIIAPFQPDQKKLLIENDKLKKRIKELERLLQQTQ